ncbi:MAG: agmatine deiminase family protein [Geminicoccaceae bacterium]
MPPEWAPHQRCWMIWPCRPELWGERMAAARKAYAEMVKSIAQFEPVTVIARPELTAEASLQLGQGISVLPLDHDDSWARDTAPTFVRDRQGTFAGVDWRFNGYGERSPAYAKDGLLAGAICERLTVARFEAPVVLEGGAIHVDGERTCVACASSILDPKRNPGRSRAELEAVLGEHLDVSKVIWLERGLADDETGGHVDNVACFVRPGVVMALTCRSTEDPNHAALQENLERLKSSTDASGRELQVIEVEQPAARFRDDERRITASYINFYLANGAVIMPMFDDPMDEPAYKTIAAAFPDRRTVQIDASDLVCGGGGIHCITQQQPA